MSQRLEDRYSACAQFVTQLAQVLVATGEVGVAGRDVLDLNSVAPG